MTPAGDRDTGRRDGTDRGDRREEPAWASMTCETIEERLDRLESAVAEAQFMSDGLSGGGHRTFRQASSNPGTFDNIASLCLQYRRQSEGTK